MTATEQPAGTTHYVAFCDYCRTAKTFTSERSRELWESYHPHEDGFGDGDNA